MPSVLVYEYFSGGGLAGQPYLTPIVSEAYAILSSLLKDFSYNAKWRTVTVLDERIAKLGSSAANLVTRVTSVHNLAEILMSAVSEVDAVILVAPETGGVLHQLTKTVEEVGDAVLLCSTSKAVDFASNKENSTRIAKSLGICIPETVGISMGENERAIYSELRDLGFPIVTKPVDGAGSEDVFILRNREELKEALKIATMKGTRRLLAQKYIKGLDASVSLLSSRSGKTRPLSLNKQVVRLASPKAGGSYYGGGYTPLDHPLRDEAYRYASSIVSAVEGLKGYVGIDFILTEGKPVFMEINTRVTTSYAGLYRVLECDGNSGVAPAIIDAVIDDELPTSVVSNAFAYYSKFDVTSLNKSSIRAVREVSRLSFVESPPFPGQHERKEAFIVSVGRSLDEALKEKADNEDRIMRVMAK